MFFAAIGDVRGNFSALKAVLEAIDDAGIQVIVQTGNVVGSGESGAEATEYLRNRGVYCVRGREDRDVIRVERKAATLRKRHGDEAFAELQRAYRALPGGTIEWLGKLKRVRVETIDNVKIAVCNGAPSNANFALGTDTPDDRLLREREIDAPDIVVSGGGPAFCREAGGTLFVGAGPVVHGDGVAAYTLVDTESKPWTASERLVEYTA